MREDLCVAIDACDDERLKTLEVDMEDVTVFIDPVDGTRELNRVAPARGAVFDRHRRARTRGCGSDRSTVSGRINRCLGRVRCVRRGGAGAKRGAAGTHGARGEARSIRYDVEDASVRSVAGDSKNAALTAAKEIVRSTAVASGATHAHGTIGGAGNKLLAVAEGRAGTR